jgi:hypothetical protein
MKRTSLASLVFAFLFLLMAGIARAIPFTDTVQFDETVQVVDSLQYTHVLEGLTTPPYTLTDATLQVRHNGNSNNSGEVWFSYAGANNLLIGKLGTSSGQTWLTDTWVLSSAVLDLMNDTNPWSLAVKLADNTSGTDKIKLDWSVLSGNYVEALVGGPAAAVPEPGTLLLLGGGLLALAAARRKRT